MFFFRIRVAMILARHRPARPSTTRCHWVLIVVSSSYFFPPPCRHQWLTFTCCCVSQRGLGGDQSHVRTAPPSSRTTPTTPGPARSTSRLSASLPPAPGRALAPTSLSLPSAPRAGHPRPYPTWPPSSTSASTPQNSSTPLHSAIFVIHATDKRCIPNSSAAYLALIPHDQVIRETPCPGNP